MAVGDGGNDLAMVQNVGMGVAMGNAVPEVRRAAALVVADHNSGGLAQAFDHILGGPAPTQPEE